MKTLITIALALVLVGCQSEADRQAGIDKASEITTPPSQGSSTG
jgi:hypothetical protein